MLTVSQETWLTHLSDIQTIKIVPFDSSCGQKFEKLRKEIQGYLGEGVLVEHCGASSLGISGQDEIDAYIPVSTQDFNSYVSLLQKLFGTPRSHYPQERVKFVTEKEGKHIDVFVINKEHDDWKNCMKFQNYLRVHKESLEEYRKLKENLSGKSVCEYYREKLLFINKILEKTQ